jgi:hypothetical protein
MTTETKSKKKRIVTDKVLKKRLTQAERQLKAMKDRKSRKAAKKALNRKINSEFNSTFDLIDDLSRVLVTHAEDQL